MPIFVTLKRMGNPKRPKDKNQLAKLIVDLATGDKEENTPQVNGHKNAAAVELGRLGGLKGGKARADKIDTGTPKGNRQKCC